MIDTGIKFGKRRLNFMYLVAAGAIVFSTITFLLVLWEDTRVEAGQRTQLIAMTNSFVATFATNRGEGAPVPATYRRLGIEHFNKALKADNPAQIPSTVRMPGLPGLELEIVETEPHIRELITKFAVSGNHEPIVEHSIYNGRFVGRTIVPSIASDQSCVTCHNEALGKSVYEIGDVMGAFVVESDLTSSVFRTAQFSIAGFVLAFIALWFLAKREHEKVQAVMRGLKAKVKLEKEKRKAEEQQKFLQSHDALTGLANRTMFLETLEQEIDKKGLKSLVVGFIDVDDFKTVNDTWGHAAGDAVLTEIARRLSTLTENNERTIARMGGDEFAIVLRLDDNLPSANNLGQTLCDALRAEFEFNGILFHPKCSIGLVNTCDVKIINSTEIMKVADATLYETKDAGKNGYMVFDESIQSAIDRKNELATQLPIAIQDNKIRVAFQPKHCLTTGKLTSVEALARWNHNFEEIPPYEFVQIAEDIGCVCDLDLLILRKAAEFSVEIKRQFGIAVPISTNFSAIHFRSHFVEKQILSILKETELPPSLFTMEITETTAVACWETVKETVSALRSHGIRASLDDFGMGYSSLNYLQKFDFDEIKVDREFITNAQLNQKGRFIFNSIIDLAKGLGSSIIVEGIENEEQAFISKRQGANTAQGYLFGRPMEIPNMQSYLVEITKNLDETLEADAVELRKAG